MAARRKHRTNSKVAPDSPGAVPPRGRPSACIAAPSNLQKWVLAAAMVAELAWMAALVAMAVAE